MKIRHLTSLRTSVGVPMEMPPFTMISFQSAHGSLVRVLKFSETDGGIAS